MANLKTVQVPAEVKLQVANQAQVMRNLYKDFQDIFASVDPGSAFGKSIAKAFSKVESKLSASEGLLSGEFFSEADLRKVASQLSSISELFGQINIQARGVSAGTLGLDTTEIDNAEKHLRQLQDRVRELKKAKVGTLLGADSKDLQAFAKLSSTTGFSGGKSYAENYKSMEAAIGRVTEKYGQLTIEAQGAEEAVRQANEEVAKARVNLNMAEGQLANRKQANFNVANQIMGVKVSGKGATRDSITEQYLAMLDSQLDQGQWVAGGENFAHIIAGWLEVDEADLAGTATDIVNNLKNAIRTAMAGGPIASNKLRASAKSVLGGEEAALRKDAGYVELEQKVQTSTTYVQGAEIAAEEALSTLQAANNTVEQTRQLLEQIQTQMTRLKQLQDEYNTAVDAQHREQIDAARQGVSTAKANTKAGTINATEEASKTAGRTAQGVQTNLSQMQAMREAADAQAKAEAAAAKESEQFSANLKASVARWMSVQQIINIVKNGIRQAYQDIQSLDKAMTNIAVVTDMSVGDLWGKINEYMSIAQQYGVTTQGVYEVSQLYYQQGLSTSDVMAATTETLKMARIAGMDYAEAADAMTVAIRAFKLEMSDAQHITDVYSKVAAVTASDTEELAIAMSKTASSAESVGSSFENTTAMLAVMIETTRESAQNLGSALKSIISRYGEMKVGLSVDSEGEEIDYNKVDTALKSVGISIKDAQGQFRDFDDVIFELSEKWDSLDKNTQRYIATIMAGNRQQSRFIALVDNWERLDEVAAAAQDSEDAGLLQYAKTLDSLETKLNNIKTSFQEFYMSILNGPFIGGILTFINELLQGLNKFSDLGSIINIITIIRGLKTGLTAITNLFSNSFGSIITGWKTTQAKWLDLAIKSGRERGEAERRAYEQGYASGGAMPTQTSVPGNNTRTSQLMTRMQRRKTYEQMSFIERRQLGLQTGKTSWTNNSWNGSSMGDIVSGVGQIGGAILTGIGTSVAANNKQAGAVLTGLGNIASGVGTGAMFGPWGAVLGGIIGALASLPDVLSAFNKNNIREEDYQKKKEAAEDANVKRAEAKNEYSNLQSLLKQYDAAQKTKNDSDEDYQNWIDINNQLVEAYPALLGYIDEEGNAIADVTARTELLSASLEKAASASHAYYQAKVDEIKAGLVVNSDYTYKNTAADDKWYEKFTPVGFFTGGQSNYIHNGQKYAYDPTGWFTKGITAEEIWASYTKNGTSSETMNTILSEINQGKLTVERNFLGAIGAIVKNEDTGLYEFESHFYSFLNAKQQELELAGLLKGSATSNLSLLSSTVTSDDSYDDWDGYISLMYTYATEVQGLSQETIGGLTQNSTAWKELIAGYTSLYSGFTNSEQEVIQNLFEHLSEYFLQDVQDIFINELGISDYQNNDLYKIFETQWYGQNYNQLARWEQAILKDSSILKGTDLEDFSTWASKQEGYDPTKDPSEYYTLYYQSVLETLTGAENAQNKWLVDFLTTNTDSTINGYIDYLKTESNIIEKGGINASRIAQDRQAAIQQIITLSGQNGTELNQLLSTDANANSEFWNLLFTDVGTHEWAEALEAFEAKYGIEVADFNSFAFENFNTQLDGIISTVDETTKSYENYAKQQSSGFTTEEALKLAKELGGQNASLTDYFEVTKDGLLVLKDFQGSMEELYTKRLEEYNSLQKQLSPVLAMLDGTVGNRNTEFDQAISEIIMVGKTTDVSSVLTNTFGYNSRLSYELAKAINNGAIKDVNDFYNFINNYQNWYRAEIGKILVMENVDVEGIESMLTQAGFAPELAATLAPLIAEHQFKTVEELEEYLQNWYGDLGLTLDLEQSQLDAILKKQRRDTRVRSLKETSGVDYDKIEGYEKLASTGLTGISTEDFVIIEETLGLTESDYTFNTATGTYDIDPDVLYSIPMEYRNQILTAIDNETQSALSAIKNLGKLTASGDSSGEYAAAFSSTLDYNFAETYIPQLIKNIVAGDRTATQYPNVWQIGVNSKNLREKIAAELRARTGDDTITADSDIVLEAEQEMIAGYKDGLNNNVIRYLELYEKKLLGTASETELEELGDIELSAELSDKITPILTKEGMTTVDKYVAIMQAAMASGANWDEIEQYIKDGYSAKLSQLASGKDFVDLDTYDIMDQVAEAEGQYSQDMLASLFSQIYAETGKEVDMSDFTQYFEIDPETKNWVLKAGVNVNDFFASEYGESVPTWITEAFSTSEAQKQVNDAIELEDLGTSATSTIGSIMSDLANASLSDLVSLYESIYGEGSFADSGLLESYQAALEAAKRGETSALIAILQTLTQAAITAGADVDTTQIQATVKDAHNTLVSGLVTSINNGLSGTLSNIDFNNLIEQIGGAPEAYRKYVTETYDGLKLSAEGALVIASQLIDKFGNTSLVAESLVAQLGGSGALGSYEDVDNLINDIINDTDHWAHGNEEILKLLYQMRDEYSQLAEDAQFDFMNQDHFDGAADNWYTFTDNMSTAIDKLKTAFEKGGKIDYKSFDNIVTWISDLSVDGLDTQLGNTGKTLGEFTDAVLATVDATGNLDLSAAAANLGISMDDMAGALEGGLQEVAKQQVAYWKHYLNFLKGIKALQEASDEIIVEPPQVDINNEGKYTYGGQDNLTAEQAYSYWLTDVYKNFEDLTITDFDGNTVQIFSGNNNPLRQLMSFKPELFTIGDDGSVQIKEGMTSYVQQYMNQLSAWVKQEFATGDITKYIDQETGAIKIPWNEVLQIEIDTSGTPTGTANNAEEASEQTQDAAEGAAESALTASGATPNGDGSYTYTLDDMTLKIQMGANGSVEIDLTNATGTLPSAAELRKVFEGQEGFTATDDNNWVFTDPNLGFSVKCSNGTLSFDTSSMTAPAAPTAAELSTILGTAWTTTDGGKTYTTNLNGVAFVYNSATGKININASSFQLTGGLDATSLATILGGTWTTADNGATYTATIAGTTFVYESSSGLVKIDGSKFTLSGGLSATDLANLLGGTWTTSDNGATYTSTINGVTFIYESASGTVNIDSSKFSLAAGLSTEQLTALLGGSWSTTDNGVTYKSTINGVTFIYESTTGAIKVDPSGFTVSAGLTAEQLKTLLGGTWTTEDNGVTYKSTINGSTFVYESTSGKLVVTPPTVASEPTNTDFITLMQSQGWTHANGVYTKNFAGGTLTYNASAGTLAIKPSATMSTTEPDMTALLNSAFGEGGWQPNPNGGYDVLNTTTGEVLYTLPAKITITPTEGSNVGQGDNGLTADVDVTLTPNTSAIDTALAAYNNQPIKISLELTSSKNSLLNSPAYNDIIAKTRAYLDENLSTEDMQTAYYQAYSAFSPYIPSMSREDLEALQQLQSSIDFGLFINEGTEDPWWTALGEEVSAALEALPEEGELTGITALFNSLSGENLAANLLGITSLFSTLVAPELATLDLTGFITQLQSMGELELDDEEINAFVTAITALTTAITALPTEVKVSVKVSAGNSYSVINGIKNALASIKNRTVTVTTKHVSSGSDGGTEEDTVTEDASYAGNVSGLALAKGNATDKLLAGAHLAGKTLVGELGPELAVYDNQYHLLGRDGAEFVNLPNDAIVFNHRQTAGIIKGQAGYRGKALVNGNVTGPAAADGIDAAISAVEKIIKLWSNIADSSLSDLLSGGSSGGGGSGNTIKAVTEELQEWYNLSRQIEHIEQEINNLIAERANLLESDGAAYLRSLREEQALLRDQVATQEVLLEYQQLQLKRQADQINQNDIWSKFLEVDENGLLQYKNGNEANGGKGALDVLQGLNEMSGEEQVEYITKTLGYSYTNADGEKLEGEELVKQFFQEFQDQIDSYDSLYDTVHQTEEKLQQLATSIEEINNEIKENQMDLEQEIFDILVEAWEAEIEALEEQKELIEEANEAYINGLQEALQTERDMYSDNERLADREQLQRQLSLLRRSGGSASEIASLEEQLDSMLKEEYFNKQEQMIQNISDANDEQIRLLDEQIRLEQESLEYQKENGILWSKVYEVMSGSTEDILAFMQGNSQSFFTQSTLQQEQMLTEWAKKVGIYTENRKYEEHESYAKEQVWDTGAIWSQDGMSGLKSTYDALDAQGKETVRNQFASAYASARVNGADHDTALQQAAAAVKQTLEGQQGAQEDEQNQAPTNTPDTSGSETWYVAGPGKLNLRKEASTNSKCLGQYGPGTAMKVLKKDGDWFKVEVDGKTGWVMSQYLTKTKPGTGSGTEQPNNSGSDLTHWTFTFNGTKYSHYKSKASAESKIQSLADGLDAKWAKNVEDGVMTRSEYARRKTGLSTLISNAKKTLASGKHSKGYSKGGLVDYTGLALVHGKPGQPEAFLNAKQTAMIAESVKSVGDGGALDGIRATLAALNSTIRSITNNNTTQTSSFTVAPGAVTIQVAQLNDSYDVEELSKDVMNRMVAIASKSTNRGVNRR